MSVKVMGLVWDHYPAGGGERLTALAMADRADHDGGHIYPAIERVARMTRQSVRTVQYQVRKMQARGWLIVEREGGGRGKPTAYRIPIERLPVDKAVQNKTETVQDLHPFVLGKGANGDRKGATAVAPETSVVLQPSLEPILGDCVARHTEDPEFEAALANYPKRAGNNPKRTAYKAWCARRAEGVTLQALHGGVQRYARWCVATGKVGTEYVMRASTFFGPDRPFEQGFPIAPDTESAPRIEHRCISVDEHGTRCMADGDLAVGEIEFDGRKIGLRMCARCLRPWFGASSNGEKRRIVEAAVERFRKWARDRLKHDRDRN